MGFPPKDQFDVTITPPPKSDQNMLCRANIIKINRCSQLQFSLTSSTFNIHHQTALHVHVHVHVHVTRDYRETSLISH